MKAIQINVYRSSRLGDCSNNGISSRYDSLWLIHPEGYKEIDESNPPENLVKLVEKRSYSRPGEVYRYLEPVAEPNGLGWMHGGNIGESSDSRFYDVSGGYPLPIHDRCESQEMYDRLSR